MKIILTAVIFLFLVGCTTRDEPSVETSIVNLSQMIDRVQETLGKTIELVILQNDKLLELDKRIKKLEQK